MLKWFTVFIAAVFVSSPAFAHVGHSEHGSLLAGLSHPLFGFDHILAMMAVGLWASQLGGRALWMVPSAFVGAMAVGFVTAHWGAPLPFVEPVILASVIVIGLLATLALTMPLALAMTCVAAFALFHGYAHGHELGTAGALPFAIGFVVSTAVLHAAGVVLGVYVHGVSTGIPRLPISRLPGALVSLGGIWLVFAG